MIPFRRKSLYSEEERITALQNARIPDSKARRFIENRLRIPVTQMASSTAYMRVGSEKVWASYRACDITANLLISTRFRVRGQKTGTPVVNKELNRLMTQPNPWDTWQELIYQWTFHMKLVGQAYWYKDQMNSRGQPLHLYPLIPQFVKVIPDEEKKISGYEYEVNGKKIIFKPDEIIHFKRPHPSDVIKGLGDVEPSKELFREYIMRGELETRFLENGAMPSGILTKKDAVEEEEEWSRLKRWWSANYEGQNNAGKTAFLNGDWSYLKLGLTHQEMQSIESEKWSISQIFNAHGVPLSLAGIEKSSNFSTSRNDERNFRKYVVVPLLELLVGKLNGIMPDGSPSLVTAYSPAWEIHYELSGLIDVEQTHKDYKPLVDVGAMTLNELREVCGLERVDNPYLDEYYIEQGRIPLEMAGLAQMPSDDVVDDATGVDDSQEGEEGDDDEDDESEGDSPQEDQEE